MPAAARVGDPTDHPGLLGGRGVPTVLVEGRPAATVGTPHACSAPSSPPHPPTALLPPGSRTVLVGGRPAARVGDATGCGATVATGATTVQVGG